MVPRIPRHWWRRSVVATVVLGLIGLVVALVIRAENLGIAAGRYAEYARGYDDMESKNFGFTSCYGSRWDHYSDMIEADLERHRDDRAYRKERASHYARLSRSYERAARHPWLPVAPASK